MFDNEYISGTLAPNFLPFKKREGKNKFILIYLNLFSSTIHLLKIRIENHHLKIPPFEGGKGGM